MTTKIRPSMRADLSNMKIIPQPAVFSRRDSSLGKAGLPSGQVQPFDRFLSVCFSVPGLVAQMGRLTFPFLESIGIELTSDPHLPVFAMVGSGIGTQQRIFPNTLPISGRSSDRLAGSGTSGCNPVAIAEIPVAAQEEKAATLRTSADTKIQLHHFP
jgi:hypothetical protein